MKNLSLLLCAVMMLSLLGCAQKSPVPTPVPETTAPQATVAAIEAITEPATEAVTEPATEAVTEPATEAVTEPATEAVTEPATEAVTEAAEETAPTEEEVPDPTVPEAEIPQNPVIETKYYTLPLPGHWKETCFYSVVDDTTVTLREKSGYEAFGGGKLCTLMLMPTSDDTYKDFPDYELLCALDTPDGSFYVIALFPTDVQFMEDTMELYNTMAEELMPVFWNIQPKDGIEMAMP